MYDMLPFPQITATNLDELSAQINNYLVQFKEILEFILTNISVDNLSPELRAQLNSMGSEIKQTQVVREEEIQQVTNKMITVSDVINSPTLQADLDAKVKENMPTASEVFESFEMTVNYDTGHLEY